jgi:ATP-dependent protease ClpP protease subunit
MPIGILSHPKRCAVKSDKYIHHGQPSHDHQLKTMTQNTPYKIYLYDTDTDCIGSGSLSSSYIQWQLEAANGQDVEVHISSVGGSAFDAIAIYDLLKKNTGNVTTYIEPPPEAHTQHNYGKQKRINPNKRPRRHWL